jgi:antitoxin Phd
MPNRPAQHAKHREDASSHAISGMEKWKLEDAKARLSEVVRRAGTAGPQLVTIRGKEAAVVLAPEHYKRLLPKPKGHLPLVQFLRGLGLSRIQIERERDTGREIDL